MDLSCPMAPHPLLPPLPRRPIAFHAAIFPLLVSVRLERLPAMLARHLMPRFAVHPVEMAVPPFVAAGVRAKLLFLPALGLLQPLPALQAAAFLDPLLLRLHQLVPRCHGKAACYQIDRDRFSRNELRFDMAVRKDNDTMDDERQVFTILVGRICTQGFRDIIQIKFLQNLSAHLHCGRVCRERGLRDGGEDLPDCGCRDARVADAADGR